eukprot:1140878-Pelagomonas_calceolata.AAC.12
MPNPDPRSGCKCLTLWQVSHLFQVAHCKRLILVLWGVQKCTGEGESRIQYDDTCMTYQTTKADHQIFQSAREMHCHEARPLVGPSAARIHVGPYQPTGPYQPAGTAVQGFD